MPTYSGLINLNWEVLKHLTISLAFLSLFYVAIKKLPIHFFIPVCTILSFIVLLIIITSFFGCITPYHNIWYAKQMWFASLLSAFTILIWIYVIRKYFSKRIFCKEEKLSIILMIPFTISSLTMSAFSGMGELAVTQTAIPAVAAIAYMAASQFKNMKYRLMITTVTLILLLGPFYYTTARSDWNFTFFDVQPKDATVRLETGFGRGIYTNMAFSKLYDWLIANAAYFTDQNDYAISYYCAPMVHMIIGLRPSLDDTYIIIEKPNSYFEKCIKKMLERGREPSIAFIFEQIPAFDQGRQLDFSSSTDPITTYVKTHMTPASTFKISDYHIIRCYVDKKRFAEKSTQQGPASQPDSFQTLNRLTMLHIQEKNYTDAIALLSGPMLKLQPDNAGIYYNIACLFAIQNDREQAIEWLGRALEKGYDGWEKIKTDPDLENIRDSAYYQEIIKNH
jgi:hypothetical protein